MKPCLAAVMARPPPRPFSRQCVRPRRLLLKTTSDPNPEGEGPMLPVIPLLGLSAIFGGTVALIWYDTLSKEQKAEADRLTAQYARALFSKAVGDLTKAEAQFVHDRVKAHFNN
jgi:hypothetical protein